VGNALRPWPRLKLWKKEKNRGARNNGAAHFSRHSNLRCLIQVKTDRVPQEKDIHKSLKAQITG
jgi:hypothetical protein